MNTMIALRRSRTVVAPSELSVSRVLIARGQNQPVSSHALDVSVVQAEIDDPLRDDERSRS